MLYLVFSVNYQRLKNKIIHNKLDSVKSKLDHYKQEPVADLDGDPLEWWKANNAHYPMAPELGRKLWSLPATSV